MMFLDAVTDLLSIIPSIFRLIGAFICNIIYGLISMLFKLFMVVSQLNILSSDEIGPIYERVTLILTIVMVFYITFEFVKYIVQPDVMTDKEKGAGNIVLRMIVAIVLIAFVPRIFTIAYDVQNRLISSQVFSKIILGEKNMDFDTYGSAFAADMMGVFYGLNETVCNESNYSSECQIRDARVQENLRQLREEGNVTLVPRITDTTTVTIDGEDQIEYYIKFDGIMAIIVGGVILYIIVLYTIDVGVRYAQMLFLQIISPIAILGYIAPKKDGMFQKWLKQCITTYLDLFIRLSIIYFILLIVRLLGDAFNSDSLFAGIEGVGGGYKTLTYIVLIIGLFVFAQKAPKMLGELLPGGGAASIGFGLKGADRFSAAWNAGKRTAGGVAGGLYGLTKTRKNASPNMRKRDKLWSALKAGYRGVKAGAGKGGGIRKGQQAAMDSIKGDNATVNKGGTVLGHDFGTAHYVSESVRQDEQVEQLESMTTVKKTVSTSIENIKFRKQMDKMGEALVASGNEAAAKAWDGEKKQAEKLSRKYASGMINEVEYAKEMESLATTFNTKYGTNVSITKDDLELDNKSKWSSVTTALNEAKAQALDIAKRNITYTKKDNAGNDVIVEIAYDESDKNNPKQIVKYTTKDKDGNKLGTSKEEYLFNEFAEKIGDLTDIAESAVVDIKASEKYKKAHANAEGSSGK